MRSAQPMPAQDTASRSSPAPSTAARTCASSVTSALANVPADLVGERRAALLVQVRDRHARAARGELAGRRLSKSGRSSCDERPYSC